MDTLGRRLSLFIDHLELTPFAFEKAVGVGAGSISKVINHGKEIGSGIVEKIGNKFPLLDLNWLLTGHGAMLKEPDLAGQVAESGVVYKKSLRPGDILQKELDDIRAEMKEMKENLGAAVEYATKAHSLISELKQELAQQSRQAGRA